MGIHGLWDVLGDGEVISIAELAAQHFAAHNGRPLRIAVDEAGWRFNNITPKVLAKIREKEPAANTIEKIMMWRMFRLMKLNIQLMFVFDGARRPRKRGRQGGNKIDWERMKLQRQLLDHLKIPYHMAPGEAEAECARMQRMDIVDAVWSDDGDTFMFGATVQIQAYKEAKKPVEGKVRVHRADAILERHDLDDESLVCFAILAGGDYDTQGLRGCGPQLARDICRRSNGIARELCHATKHDLSVWRTRLEGCLAKYGRGIVVPSTFPDFKALGHYREPVVSTPEQIRNLDGLKYGWDRPIDQVKLRKILRQKFNLQHAARASNVRFDVQLKRVQIKKNANGDGYDDVLPTERKITFDPVKAIEIDVTHQPEDEDWSPWSKNGVAYDQYARIETEILDCFLRNGLPECSLITAEPPTEARKKTTGPQESAAEGLQGDDVPSKVIAPHGTPSKTSAAPVPPKKRGRPVKEKGAVSKDLSPKRRKAESPTVSEKLPTPTPKKFVMPRGFLPTERTADVPSTRTADSIARRTTRVIDLSLGDSDSEEEPNLASVPAAQSLIDPRPSAHGGPNITSQGLVYGGDEAERLVPGKAISPATLRALRAPIHGVAERNLLAATNPPVLPKSQPRSPPILAQHEVIDLT